MLLAPAEQMEELDTRPGFAKAGEQQPNCLPCSSSRAREALARQGRLLRSRLGINAARPC